MAAMNPRDPQVERFPSNPSISINPVTPSEGYGRGAVGTFDAAEGRAGQLSFLLDVARSLVGAVDVEPALGPLLARLADRENLSFASLVRLNPVTDPDLPPPSDIYAGAGGGEIPLRDSALLRWVIAQKQEVYVPRVEMDPRCQNLEGHGVRSVYAVPLQAADDFLGILAVGADHANGIRSGTRNLIDQFAAQAAQALARNKIVARLFQSEQRFRSIFEQVPVGILLATPDGRFSKVNPALAQLLGLTCSEIEGRHFGEITAPEDAAEIEARVRDLRDGVAREIGFERPLLRKSGAPVECATSVTLLREQPGATTHFLAIVRDITERKKAEQQQERLQQQMFQAQKMEAVGTLAGGIAHDFNNLLNVMLGFASLARQKLRPDDPLHDSMGMIEESAERAADLARQLLGFARPEIQQVRPVCVQQVVHRVRRMVERTFDRKIKVEILLAPEPVWVNAEPSYLEQAILNLCLNARDAMPGGGRLAIEVGFDPPGASGLSATEQKRASRAVRISVRDSGDGISPADLPKVFDPFFTTKERSRGTGLGLTMVYTFVKNQDGDVKVESVPGKGSVFTMVLPTMPSPPAHPASEIVKIEPAEGVVLVVDDEPLVRAFACEGLKRIGYEVLVAENGTQALSLYSGHPGKIDCVLLDLIMPELSGLDTYRRLREIDPKVTVLFASGYSTGEILRQEPEARDAAFIGKPYTLERLSSLLRNVMEGEKCRK
jgi:PAS domain S-box-containing protein